jgi:hypothetical protein
MNKLRTTVLSAMLLCATGCITQKEVNIFVMDSSDISIDATVKGSDPSGNNPSVELPLLP